MRTCIVAGLGLDDMQLAFEGAQLESKVCRIVVATNEISKGAMRMVS